MVPLREGDESLVSSPRLASLSNAWPLHQIRQCLPGAGSNLSLNSSSASATRFLAAFAERSCIVLAMVNLFYATGRQCQPGLSFALLGAKTSHAATFT